MRKTILRFFLFAGLASIPNVVSAVATSDTVTVSTLDALKTAVQTAVATRLVVIQNNTDVAGYYDLTTGLTFPMNKGELTLKAATGNSPVIRGTFKSLSGTRMILNKLTIDGITLDGNDGSAQSFMVSNGDSVFNTYTIRNCFFKNQKTNQFWYSNGQPSLVQNVLIENCTFENFGGSNVSGTTGGTFVQLQNKTTSRNDKFIIRNNTFTNWHGNIFFNSARQTTTDTTGIELTIENNTFYKIGGNATTDRNFIEWANVPKWFKVKGSSTGTDTTVLKDIPFTLNIRNNLFHKNQATNVGKLKIVKLFAPNSANQVITLNFQKNVYDPTEVDFQLSNTTRTWAEFTSSTLAGLGLTENIFVDQHLADSIGNLTLIKPTPLSTYGVGGTVVGDPRWYNSSTGVNSISSTKMEAYTDGNRIYVRGTEKPITLFSVLGQRIGTFKSSDAQGGIYVNKGLVFVSTSEGVVKVMVK